MTTIATYRNGHRPSQERLETALAHFGRSHTGLPAAIIVNPTEAEKTRQAVGALQLSIPVETSGGCLVPEVWLLLPKRNGKPVASGGEP